VASTQIILFLEMLKFSENIFLKENKLFKKWFLEKKNLKHSIFKMESSKLTNYSTNR
jgi:hypothetical protein